MGPGLGFPDPGHFSRYMIRILGLNVLQTGPTLGYLDPGLPLR